MISLSNNPYLKNRLAGISLPLSSMKVKDDWGCGDMASLQEWVEYLSNYDMHILQILPLWETAPREHCPYSALSAYAIDPVYISIKDIPEVQKSPIAQEILKDLQPEIEKWHNSSRVEFDTIKQFNFLRESVPTKQIFISDGDIIRNYYDPRSGFFPTGYDVYTRRFYDNTEFLTNCVDYLCDNEYLIELRSKIFRIGLLNQNKIASKTMRQKIQGITIGIPLILVVLIGVVMIFTRRKKYEH